MLLARVAQRLEVSGLRLDDADVHHHGLEDHRGDLALVVRERLFDRRRVVERHHDRRVPERLRDALGRGLRRVPGLPLVFDVVTETEHVRLRHDGEEHRIVVAVVGPLHLQQLVAAGGSSRDPDRVHRGLGPGVDDPQLLQLEALADRLGEGDGGGRGDGEVDRLARGLLQGLHDLGVSVTHDVHSEAAVEVLVLRAVHVPDARSLPLLEVDRVRVPDLEVRGDPVGEALESPLMEGLGRGRVRQPGIAFALGDLRRSGRDPFEIHLNLLRV